MDERITSCVNVVSKSMMRSLLKKFTLELIRKEIAVCLIPFEGTYSLIPLQESTFLPLVFNEWGKHLGLMSKVATWN